MDINKNTDKEQLEKLTEKHQQIQSGIKNLQNIEEGLFKNLEKAKKTQGSQSEQQELLNHIGKLSAVREQLFKDLKVEYEKQLNNTLGGSEKLGTQTAMLNNTEKQLNKLKTNLGKAQRVRANRKRMIQIGDYEFQRYGEQKELMKIIAFTGLGIIISVALLKKEIVPKPFAQAGIVASGAIGSIFLIYQLIDMWYRDNMDYNKYNFGFWYEPGPPQSWPENQKSRWDINKQGASKIFWGKQKSDPKEKEAKQDLSRITGNDDGPSDDMQPGADGADTGQPEDYEEQVNNLFTENNCPEGARVRGYCVGKKEKYGEYKGGAGGAGGGNDSSEDRPSLVGSSSKWKGLEFDNQHTSEGFEGAGAGKNYSGVVVPFGGF